MIEDHELFVRENLPQNAGKIVSFKEIRNSLEFQSTITAEGMLFSCKKTAPFRRPSITGSMVDAALLRKINPHYSRPSIIEPVKQESADIGYLLRGPRTTPKPRRTRSPDMETADRIEGK